MIAITRERMILPLNDDQHKVAFAYSEDDAPRWNMTVSLKMQDTIRKNISEFRNFLSYFLIAANIREL